MVTWLETEVKSSEMRSRLDTNEVKGFVDGAVSQCE
jgi:hypothetical protein